MDQEAVIRKAWLKKNERTIVKVNRKKESQSYIGFLSQRKYQCHLYEIPWQNSDKALKAMEQFLKAYPDKKIAIVWDNTGWRRGIKVTEWIENDGNIKTIHFLPYTPDLNPQEHVWKAGWKEVSHNQYVKKIDETAEEFKQYVEGRTFAYELLGLRAEQAQV